MDDIEFNQVIVFTQKCKYADKLNEIISGEGFPSIVSSGSMPTEKRIQVYNQFKEGKYRVMVSTDLLGRGIDIEKINVVFNFDMPNEVN